VVKDAWSDRIENETYFVSAASVKGWSHHVQNLPRQDAGKICVRNGVVLCAIADGHGSDKCPFSKHGAEFAVDIAVSILDQYVSEIDIKKNNTAKIFGLIKESFPKKIEIYWKKKVKEDYSIRLQKTEGLNTEISDDALYILYGTTLLVSLVSETFVLFFQLGDGDIVLVMDDETSSALYPIDQDPQLIGNLTTSLCSKNSQNSFRTRMLNIEQNKFKMFCMATDGYDNSFPDGLYDSVIEYHNLYYNEKSDINLEEYLNIITKGGSGDDITAVLVFTKEASNKNGALSDHEVATETPGILTDNNVSGVEPETPVCNADVIADTNKVLIVEMNEDCDVLSMNIYNRDLLDDSLNQIDSEPSGCDNVATSVATEAAEATEVTEVADATGVTDAADAIKNASVIAINSNDSPNDQSEEKKKKSGVSFINSTIKTVKKLLFW